MEKLAMMTPQEKAELDRILALPETIDPEEPQEWFHDAQRELWKAKGYKIVAFVAGAQSGKTVAAPFITLREIARKFEDGIPNDHLVASPTYKLMSKKLLPEYKRIIVEKLGLGEYIAGDVAIVLSAEGIARLTGIAPSTGTSVTIWFGHAQAPESLESATYKSAVLDEAGQEAFRSGSFEAILRRLTVNKGVMYILTTPYNRNWFYEKVYRKGLLVSYDLNDDYTFTRKETCLDNADSGILVISCPSLMNPSFPLESWEFSKKTYSDWEFEMFHMGRFSLPPGVVFDSFTEDNICDRFPIPPNWPVYAGIDFGLVNTAAVLIAEEWKDGEATGRYFLFGSYHAGEARESRDHVKHINKMCPVTMPIAYGGAHAESGWRESWSSAGLPVYEPSISGLWIQINILWTAFAQNKLIVFSDMQNVINELRSMSREVDEDGIVVSDKIKDEQKYHRIAGLRYIATRLFRGIYRSLKRDVAIPDNMPEIFQARKPKDSRGSALPKRENLGGDG